MKSISFFSLSYHLFIKFLTVIGSFVTLNLVAGHLGATAYGYWAQINSTANLLVPVVLLQLPVAFVRFYQAKDFPSNQAMGSLLIVNWVTFAFLGGLFLLFEGVFSQLLFGRDDLTDFLRLLFVFVFFKSNLQMVTSYFRASGQTNTYSNILAIDAAVQIILLWVFIAILNFSVEGVVLSYVAVDAVIVLIILLWMWLFKKNLRFVIANQRKTITHFVYYCIPLVPHVFLFWIFNLSDRYFLVHYHGIKTTGIYNAAYLFGSMLIVVQAALNFIVLPEAIRLWEAGRKYAAFMMLKQFQDIFLLSGIFVVGVFSVVGADVLKIVGTGEFDVPPWVIMLITTGALLFGTDQFIRNIFHLQKKTKQLPLFFLVTAVCNVLFNFLLIPRLGIFGAACSTFITFLIQYLILVYYGYKVALLLPDYKNCLKVLLVVALAAITAIYWSPYLVTDILIFVVAYFLAVFLFNWIDIKGLWSMLNKNKVHE